MSVMEENQNNEVQYIQERMKQRPLNRRKLIRRMIITASMAVIFGVLACITFLVLEPVFSNMLHPSEEPETVEIPADEEDEILPEDMMLEEEPEIQTTIQVIERPQDVDVLDIYTAQYQDMHTIAQNTMRSIVTVTSVNQDVDWFDNEYQSTGTTSGLYVASNGLQLLFLVYTNDLQDAEEITITFHDGVKAKGELKQYDANTGLSVVSVAMQDVPSNTIKSIAVAKLANSKLTSLLASPVMAIGRPYGTSDSIAYGYIASKGSIVHETDQNYEVLMTNIYGSSNATGILVNLSGEVLGIIDQRYAPADSKNLISAVGISDIKKTIERMSNGKTRAYLGITGTDVSSEIHETLGLPQGAYVTSIIMGSPAMNAGIQSGDVIVAIDDVPVTDFSKFTDIITSKDPDTSVKVTLMRQGGDNYREMDITITLEELK